MVEVVVVGGSRWAPFVARIMLVATVPKFEKEPTYSLALLAAIVIIDSSDAPSSKKALWRSLICLQLKDFPAAAAATAAAAASTSTSTSASIMLERVPGCFVAVDAMFAQVG